MSKESSITATICRNLRQRGIFHWKTTGSVFGKSGLPDLMVVIEGRLIALEVKRPGKAATRLQKHRMEQLRKAGAVAEVVTGWPEAEKAMGLST
jgi:Holliday junction resolvase